MIEGRCPICAKAFTIARLDDLPSFPFCSPRCRQIDLGRWIDGSYVIPGPPAKQGMPRENGPVMPEEDEHDSAG